MQSPNHSLSELFTQLGLPAEPAAIDAFVSAHRPLPNGIRLEDAPFWSDAQRTLLREDIADDADWASMADLLNNLLRA